MVIVATISRGMLELDLDLTAEEALHECRQRGLELA
jgi:hypothetical protein